MKASREENPPREASEEEAASLVKKYLEAHQKKRIQLLGDARELLTKNRRYLASAGK